MLNCPLCNNVKITDFFQNKQRNFLQCNVCKLVFISPEQFLSEDEEKTRYNLHQNSPDNSGYINFLNRIFNPMHKILKPGSRGLDFGSGPEPVLAEMFRKAGYTMKIYDYFYACDNSALEKKYDFITASEVVEHLHNPRKELDVLWNCLSFNGYLGIMTEFIPDKKEFAKWQYKNDLTHVCFFSFPAFEWLAEKWQAKLTFIKKNIVFFQKF